jgi:hypothetical protein
LRSFIDRWRLISRLLEHRSASARMDHDDDTASQGNGHARQIPRRRPDAIDGHNQSNGTPTLTLP